jgi:hypothetical protein
MTAVLVYDSALQYWYRLQLCWYVRLLVYEIAVLLQLTALLVYEVAVLVQVTAVLVYETAVLLQVTAVLVYETAPGTGDGK